MKKKTYITLLAAFVFSLLTGCGNKAATDISGSEPEISESTPAENSNNAGDKSEDKPVARDTASAGAVCIYTDYDNDSRPDDKIYSLHDTVACHIAAVDLNYDLNPVVLMLPEGEYSSYEEAAPYALDSYTIPSEDSTHSFILRDYDALSDGNYECMAFYGSEDNGIPLSDAYTFNYVRDHKLHVVETSSRSVLLSEFNTVNFYVELSEDEARNDAAVTLRNDNGDILATFNDNNTDHDKEAGDNIYTCSYANDINERTQVDYTVYINDEALEPITIHYYTELTDDDFADIDTIADELGAICNKYYNDEGYLDPEQIDDAYSEVSAKILDYYRDGRISDYIMNPESVEMTHYSGIYYIYEFKTPKSVNSNSSPDIYILPQ